ncbi:MAG: galactokinase [Pyrinomonadaceae bacterium]
MPDSMSQPHYKVAYGETVGLRDVEDFIALLNALDVHAIPAVRELFDANADVFIARAPGRLDVIGGIADYSGSLVLEMPTAEATLVAAQRAGQSDAERKLKIISLINGRTRKAEFEMPLADFERNGMPISYEDAQAYFRRDASRQWAAYAAGIFLVLMHERGIHVSESARLLISSSVPEGKGVSSSAALEVAVMSAIAASYEIKIEPREVALLCQKVENLVVGAPCGVMDQMTSACGEQGKLLALLCQPAELQDTITLPPDLAVWGLDSGVRHSVGGGDYGSVRTGAFMGYRILAAVAGLRIESPGEKERMIIDDPRWRGYLSNVTPSEFENSLAAHLPEQIAGDEFLALFGGTTDKITRVEPRLTYAVRRPTAHAVYENFRVRAFAELLRAGKSERRNELLGELMYQSHASYSACGLGSEATDLLVSLVREAGSNAGLYGAKITGGGSGGTVAVLGRRSAEAAIKRVAEEFRQKMSHEPYIFAGSSPGSATFGYIKLEMTSASR